MAVRGRIVRLLVPGIMSIVTVLSAGCEVTVELTEAPGSSATAKAWRSNDRRTRRAIDRAVRDGPPSLSTEALAEGLQRPSCRVRLEESRHAPMSTAELYERCVEAVVIISRSGLCDDCDKVHRLGGGSGFLISRDGIVVTNHHVVDTPGEGLYVTTFAGETSPVLEVLAASEPDDIAILRIEGPVRMALPMATDAPVGTTVALISHPDGRFFMLTSGIVSRYRTSGVEVDDGNDGDEDDPLLVRVPEMIVSASFAPGSSGAPVLGPRGRVVGMASARESIGDSEDHPGHDHGEITPSVIFVCVPAQRILDLIEPR